MSAAFLTFLGLLGVSGFIVSSVANDEEEDQANLSQTPTWYGADDATQGPPETSVEGDQNLQPDFDPQNDDDKAPPSHGPDENLNHYGPEDGGPKIELMLSPEFIAQMHADSAQDYTAYAAFVDLDDARTEFAFTPPAASGQFYLAHFSYEEPTDSDHLVEKSMHMELLYSPSAQTPTHAELMGIEKSDLFVLAYLDLGHALFDTQSDVFVSGTLNDAPLLSQSVMALERFNMRA